MSNIKYLRQVIQAAKRDLIHERRHEAAKKLDEAAELLVNDDASEAVKDEASEAVKDEALVRYGKLWVSMKDELIPAIERRLEKMERFIDGSSMGCAEMSQRLERLGNSVDELFGYRNSFIADHQEAGSRIEKMEKALSEEMAKTRELDDILAGVVKKVGYKSEAPENDGIERWCIGDPSNPIARWQFNPKASPSGIPFSLALEFLKAGRKIRFGRWIPTRRVEGRGTACIGGMDVVVDASRFVCDFSPNVTEMTSSEWEVLPEKPQNP